VRPTRHAWLTPRGEALLAAQPPRAAPEPGDRTRGRGPAVADSLRQTPGQGRHRPTRAHPRQHGEPSSLHVCAWSWRTCVSRPTW